MIGYHVQSLTKVVVRNDPGYYRFMVTTCLDKNWKLVSFPWYMKGVVSGKETRFTFIDIKVYELLASGSSH